jgi:hypothetical protein
MHSGGDRIQPLDVVVGSEMIVELEIEGICYDRSTRRGIIRPYGFRDRRQ